jgi:hypothetical protein
MRCLQKMAYYNGFRGFSGSHRRVAEPSTPALIMPGSAVQVRPPLPARRQMVPAFFHRRCLPRPLPPRATFVSRHAERLPARRE